MLLPKNSKNPLNSLPFFCDLEDPYPFQTYMFQVFRNLAVAQAEDTMSFTKDFLAWIAMEFFEAICNITIKPKPPGSGATTGIVTITRELRDFAVQRLSNYPGSQTATTTSSTALPMLETQGKSSPQQTGVLGVIQNFARTQVTQAECLAQQIMDYVCREWIQAMTVAQVRIVNGAEVCDIKISKELYDLTSQILTELKGSKRRKFELVPECRELFGELKKNGLTPHSPKPKEDLNLLTEAEIFNTQVPSQERRSEIRPIDATKLLAAKESLPKTEVCAKSEVAAKTEQLKPESSVEPTNNQPRERRKQINL